VEREDWRDIPGFPKYQVSSLGRVLNKNSVRILQPSKNQEGHLKVNLMRDGEACTRTVNHLVAKAFLPKPPRRDFISVIHLDGDKSNCRATNLAWRPRYFAIKYHQQFETRMFHESRIPITDVQTGVRYPTAQAAVVQHGLLLSDIVLSMHERTVVWPTYQEFLSDSL
jgi:hypothetical protein